MSRRLILKDRISWALRPWVYNKRSHQLEHQICHRKTAESYQEEIHRQWFVVVNVDHSVISQSPGWFLNSELTKVLRIWQVVERVCLHRQRRFVAYNNEESSSRITILGFLYNMYYFVTPSFERDVRYPKIMHIITHNDTKWNLILTMVVISYEKGCAQFIRSK